MAPVPTSNPGLVRSLRRRDLVAVVINGVIGAGIFGLPSKMFALAGDFSLLSFVVCLLCVSFIVLSFAEVSSRFSETGGPYFFARATYGPMTGFAVGWLVWLTRVTSFSANCSLLPDYLGFFAPTLASGLPRALIVTTVVVALAAVNIRGLRLVTDSGNVFAIGKLVLLAAFVVGGLFFVATRKFPAVVAPGYHPFSQSVLLLVYAFTGFEVAVIPAGEIRNPQKTLPSALMLGMGIVAIVYMLIQLVCIGTLPGLATSQRPLADAAASFMGTSGAVMITAAIVISLAGNLNVNIFTASRLIFAMAERDELPKGLAAIHPRFRTPAAAVVLTTVVMLALTLSGTFVYLITLSVLARLVAYFVTCSAVPVLRRRLKTAASFHLPGGMVIPVAGMLVIIWLLSNSTLSQVGSAVIATLVGLTAYWLNRCFRRA
jgi:amino acid transporter